MFAPQDRLVVGKSGFPPRQTIRGLTLFHAMGEGELRRAAKYSDVTASFYGEYGITNSLTGMLYFPFLRHHSLETTESVTAPGDAIVGFKYGLLRGATPFAVAVDFGVPTGEAQGLVAIKGVPDGSFRWPTGDGEFNTRVSLYASRAFRDGNMFLSGGGGYNVRTRGYTDEVSYFVNAGHHLFSAFWVTGTVMGLFPAGEPDIERSVGFGATGASTAISGLRLHPGWDSFAVDCLKVQSAAGRADQNLSTWLSAPVKAPRDPVYLGGTNSTESPTLMCPGATT